MTDFQKKGYFNLIRFAKKAFQLKLDQSLKNVEAWKASVMTLQSAIQEDGVVFNKTWLTGKVGEMLRK